MSNLSTLANSALVGQYAEFATGKDVILGGSYVKSGTEVDKVEFKELYDVLGDAEVPVNEHSAYGMGINNCGVFGTSSVSNISFGTSFVCGSTYIQFGMTISAIITSVTRSIDGESWDVPTPVSISGVSRIRVFGDTIAVCYNVGVSISTDLGFTWSSIYMGNTVYDIAFDGSIYALITSSSVVRVDSTTLRVLSAGTGASFNGATTNIVYANGVFILNDNGNTSTYKSINGGLTWTAGGTLSASPKTTSTHLFSVNNIAVVFLGNTHTFAYTTNGTTWTQSSTTNNIPFPNIHYDGSKYLIASSDVTTVVYSYTTLNTSPTSFTVNMYGNTSNPTAMLSNGSSYLICSAVGGSACTYSSLTLPTANVVSDKILGSIVSAGTVLSGGLLSSVFRRTSDYVVSLYKEVNGVFVPVKRSPTNYVFTTVSDTSAKFLHYAKDAGVLYWSKVTSSASNTITRATINLDTDVMGTEYTDIVPVNYAGVASTAVRAHTNGLVFIQDGTSYSFIGTELKTANIGVSPATLSCSYTGDFMCTVANTYTGTAVSTDYGETWKIYKPMLLSAAGAAVTPTGSNAMLYKLGSLYYSGAGSFVGVTPFLLTYSTQGITDVTYGTLAASNFLVSASSEFLLFLPMDNKLTSLPIPSAAATTLRAVSNLTNGDIVISALTGGSVLLKKPQPTTGKFRVLPINTDSLGKSVYIKAK